ncbi:MAG: aldo/keto reductase [Rhodoluna sp.]|nr:aldo/keto reductase [Rhodoluna sp.]
MSYEASQSRYDNIKTRRVGHSGLILPEISLGLWHNFGSVDDFANQKAILHRAFDLGVFHFDLANNYGPIPGSAEENFGQHLRDGLAKYRDELIISSKAGYDMWPGPFGEWGSRKYLTASLDQSLKRMGLEYVDIFYSHRFDPNTPLEETMGALAKAVHDGKALYVGISSYSPADTARAKEILDGLGVPLTIHQPRYSMFDRTPENGLLTELERINVGAIVFSPLAQGLLTDRYFKGIPEGSRASKAVFLKENQVSEKYLTAALALNELAAARGQTLSQLALSWVLRKGIVSSALIGASSVAQLESNLAALDSPTLTQSELHAIEPLAIHGLG